jgi:hypothetical protein
MSSKPSTVVLFPAALGGRQPLLVRVHNGSGNGFSTRVLKFGTAFPDTRGAMSTTIPGMTGDLVHATHPDG